LKTYLPDGDIDLATFGSACSDESLANEVRAILESEERRKDAEFEVKDVQYINAEVSLWIALYFVVLIFVRIVCSHA
jgi:molybdopterin-guanine dinucleotide biosynthesis protein A